VAIANRLIYLIISALIISCAQVDAARAGFFGGDEGKSGLDFNNGYDQHTVGTISGRAIAAPHRGERDTVVVAIKSGDETLNVVVGPGSYWEKKGIPISGNDELSVKGSRAQGKDGKTYLLAQKLVNRSSGAQVDLRNEKGEPAWSGRAMTGAGPEGAGAGMKRHDGGAMRDSGAAMRNSGGAMRDSGGMMRSGGGMMRSGGGMMRR